tara:strand:+ start:719 stop:1000 length:282 start_codon:yes stop_codon:yes gene_type:complete
MKDEIQKFIDEDINPALSSHGGFLEIVDFDSETSDIYVKMGGGCQGCAVAAKTLYDQVEVFLREEFTGLGRVHDMTNHEAGETPYFKRAERSA